MRSPSACQWAERYRWRHVTGPFFPNERFLLKQAMIPRKVGHRRRTQVLGKVAVKAAESVAWQREYRFYPCGYG